MSSGCCGGWVDGGVDGMAAETDLLGDLRCGHDAEAELLLDQLADRLPRALGGPEAHLAERGQNRFGKTRIVAMLHAYRGRVHLADGVDDIGGLTQALGSDGEQIARIDRRGAGLVALHYVVHLEHAEDAVRDESRHRTERQLAPGAAPIARAPGAVRPCPNEPTLARPGE